MWSGMIAVVFIGIIGCLLLLVFRDKQFSYHGRRRKQPIATRPHAFPRHSPKPVWVRQEVIRSKARMPEVGCRTVTHTFNRLYQHKRRMTVGKTFVSYTIRKHHSVPKHRIWAMDLTGKTDTKGIQHPVLGIVEHHSRACLTLEALSTKASIMLLRKLLDTIEAFGHIKPRYLRTDNEAIFISHLFRFGLWLLRIKHQRTEMACPWQNGRIERFFGTLKVKLNQWEVDTFCSLNESLRLFRCWYNHVRPHQHLNGRTPAEVWQGKADFKSHNGNACWFEAWDGLLTGYYLPP